MTTALAVSESLELKRLEARIRDGLGSFVEVGKALQRIRDGRLYRETHSTFEDYCRERWQMTRSKADRYIGAGRTVEGLTPIGVTPTNEAQARPLASLPADKQREAWEEAVETAPKGKVTARHVAAVVASKVNGDPRVGRSQALRVGAVLLSSIDTLEAIVYALERVEDRLGEASPEITKRYREVRARLVRLVRNMGEQNAED